MRRRLRHSHADPEMGTSNQSCSSDSTSVRHSSSLETVSSPIHLMPGGINLRNFRLHVADNLLRGKTEFLLTSLEGGDVLVKSLVEKHNVAVSLDVQEEYKCDLVKTPKYFFWQRQSPPSLLRHTNVWLDISKCTLDNLGDP